MLLPTFRLTYQNTPSVVCQALDFPVEVGPICLSHILYLITDMDVYSIIHLCDEDGSYKSAIDNLIADMKDPNGLILKPNTWGPYIDGMELEVGIESNRTFLPIVKLFQRYKNSNATQICVDSQGKTRAKIGIWGRKELPLDKIKITDIINYPVVLHEDVAFDGSTPGLKLTVFAFLECLVKGLFLNKKMEKKNE